MKDRLVSASILLFLAALVFGLNMLYPLALNIVFLLLVILALYECFKVSDYLKRKPLMIVSGLYVTAFALVVAFSELRLAMVVVFLYILSLIVFVVYDHQKYTYENIGFVLLITLYVSFGFTSLMLMKNRNPDIATFLVFLVLFGAWISDVGGWLFGKLFGRHKLSPGLSPKKTIEGAFGSFALCFGFFIVSGIVYSAYTGAEINYYVLGFLAIPFGAATIIGDLAASALKRETGVKDFSNLFPGHGGIMDRFDSMLLSSIFMLVALEFVSFIKI